MTLIIQDRQYQDDIIAATRAKMLAGCRHILIQSSTGSGKTVLTAKMLKTAMSKGMDAWFICHRIELVRQSIMTFSDMGIRLGVISSGFQEDKAAKLQVCSISTLTRRWQRFRKPTLVFWDEAHHVAAKSWDNVHAGLPEAFHVGLTATPQRLDGAGLGKWFKEMVNGPSTKWLIENGFLSPYRIFAPPGLSLSGVHVRMGDYVKSELAAAVDKPTITGDAIKHYLKHAAGKRAVVFCASVAHSEHVVAQFNAAGIKAEHVDGETDHGIRKDAVRRFAAGEIKVLSNVDLFSEGFDLPAIEVAILLRPTQSLGLYLQQVGRALRPCPGKDSALILDHAGNCEKHGLPDEERDWSLAGRCGGKASGGEVGAVKVCPKCFAAQISGQPACSFCGFVFEVKGGRQVDEVAGELQEIDLAAVRAKRLKEQAEAGNDEASLISLAKKRGYKRPLLWARHIMMARAQKKAQKEAEAKWGAP